MPQDNDMGSFSSPSATMKAANFQVIQGKVSTDFYKQSINFSCEFITTVGSFILILGVAISTVNIFVSIINDCVGTEYPMLMSLQRNKQCAATFARVRMQLGKSYEMLEGAESFIIFVSLIECPLQWCTTRICTTSPAIQSCNSMDVCRTCVFILTP